MPSAWRTILIAAAAAFLTGALGVYAGLKLGSWQAERPPLDAMMHHQLHLTHQQDEAIEGMEGRYHAHRAALENEMRAATRDLASAMSEDGAYTPRVRQCVDRFHSAMATLQRETVEHVFEMRAVLTPAQQQRFDEIVRTRMLNAANDGA